MTIEMVPAPTDVELILAIDHSHKLHDCSPVVVVMHIAGGDLHCNFGLKRKRFRRSCPNRSAHLTRQCSSG